MTWPAALSLIGSILGTAGLILSGWLAYKATTKAKEIEGTSTPYEQLSRDVVDLRQRVNALEHDLWTDRRYILDIHQLHPQMPAWMPDWLSQRYGLGPSHPPTPGSIIQPPKRKET